MNIRFFPANRKIQKAMEKSSIVLLTFFIPFLSFLFDGIPLFGQVQSSSSTLSKDQYELINMTYAANKNDKLKLYRQTVDDSSWIDRLLDYRSEEYLFVYKFKNEELPAILNKLQVLGSELSVKFLEKNKLSSKTKFKKKREDGSTVYMAEPIIFSNYAFVFIRKPKSETVYVYFQDPELGWIEECVIPLEFVIECYFG
jgi:hypothetical protein